MRIRPDAAYQMIASKLRGAGSLADPDLLATVLAVVDTVDGELPAPEFNGELTPAASDRAAMSRICNVFAEAGDRNDWTLLDLVLEIMEERDPGQQQSAVVDVGRARQALPADATLFDLLMDWARWRHLEGTQTGC
jgi:hypothetical protein